MTDEAENARMVPKDAALHEMCEFLVNYFAPWGAWKTAWWEGVGLDDEPFGPDAALRHIQRLAARAAIAKATP